MDTHPNTYVESFAEVEDLIDASEVVDMVERWMREDGQPLQATNPSIHTLLTAWLATALAGKALDVANVTTTLYGPDATAAKEKEVLRLTRQVLDTIDYSPLPITPGPLTKAAYEDISQGRKRATNYLSRQRRRYLSFTNAILRAQHEFLELVDDEHSVALGALARSADVEGISPDEYLKLDDTDHVSAEPDAGFIRGGEGDDGYGWEYQVATLVSNDLLRSSSVPNIIIAVAGHKPGHQAAAVEELVPKLFRYGTFVDHVTGDLSYFPTLDPDHVQGPLRGRGAKLVMEYRPHLEGVVLATADGSVLVEGRWYRDNLPEALQTVMKDFREASLNNRSADGSRVLDAAAQQRLEEQRDALLEQRHAFEVATPSTVADKHEQAYAYGSTEWAMAFSQGRYAHTQFDKTFRDTDSALTSGTPSLRGEAAHGFITTLIIAAANARRIMEWEQYHSLDEGNGLMVDEWYAMYHLLVPRIQAGMAEWSTETQPGAGTYWKIDNVEDTFGWRPDGGATVVEMTSATEELADVVAASLIASLRAQAEHFLEDEDGSVDLSFEARIELALDFVDADRHGGEEGTWSAVPADGALLAAEATLVWSEV